jgi:hypothetical protein
VSAARSSSANPTIPSAPTILSGAGSASPGSTPKHGNGPREVLWHLSDRADPRVCPLADRHYNRQTIGSPQFVPPGRCVVLRTEPVEAFWITSWPFAEYVKHSWPGAWICSAFRNESEHLSSDLIREAVAATLAEFGAPPPLGMVTFVDASKTRRKRDPGRCFRRAGFRHVGFTKGGLYALQLDPFSMPEAELPLGAQEALALSL